MNKVPLIILLITGCTFFFCRHIEVDYTGVSNLYMINATDMKLQIKTIKTDFDSLIEVYAEAGDTAYICSDAAINGWLHPSEIILRTEINFFDQWGNQIGSINNTCDNDSSWTCSPNSTWQNSSWYYTINKIAR